MADAAAHAEAEPGGGTNAPSEEELREAYEAELRRISSADLLLQTTASLLNVGAFRLGLIGGDGSEHDLEQVRDAIDGVRALLPILERRGSADQLRPLRDALSQLQLAYARDVQASGAPSGAGEADATRSQGADTGTGAGPGEAPASPDSEGSVPEGPGAPTAGDDPRRPGPAESSGRLWVPGKG
jgi:hypothetical protein